MGTITIVMDDEVEKKLRERVSGKGALGQTISEATRDWLEEQEQEEIRRRGLEILRKGFNMGKKLYKKREDLYDRFESSRH